MQGCSNKVKVYNGIVRVTESTITMIHEHDKTTEYLSVMRISRSFKVIIVFD